MLRRLPTTSFPASASSQKSSDTLTKASPPTGWHEWISWPSWLLNCLVLDYIRLHTLYLLLQPCLEYVLSICLL
ncbi:hypothetical protein AAHC03_05270 [Spirometra sp. Aus1]